MKKSVWIFVGLTFGVSWLMALGVFLAGAAVGSALYSVLAMAIMFVPGVCALITRKITGEGFQNAGLKPRLRGNIRFYVLAWFVPALMVGVGTAVYFLLFPQYFDPNMTALAEALRAQGAEMPAGTLILTQVSMALLIAPIINLLPSMGEELGWRGYLLPKLNESMGARKATILSGVIWGLWHAPLIAMGHNYGTEYAGWPWLGILVMTLTCVFLGAFLSWLTLRVKSAWVAALGHGAFNAIAGIGVCFAAAGYNPLIGPMGLSLVGAAGAYVVGAICLWKIGERKAEA